MVNISDIISFINNIASDQEIRNYSGIVFLSPILLALFVIYKSMEINRGQLKKIKLYVFISFIFGVIMPFSLVVHSLIYINQLYNLPLFISGFLCLPMFLANVISGYYTRFSYLSDEEYTKHTFINGYHIDTMINIPKFKLVNTIFFLIHIITLITLISSLYLLITNQKELYLHILIGITSLGVYLFMLYFIWFRWYFKCPHCKNPIYSSRAENGRRLYFYIMLRILRYNRFTCMYCHAHYQLGERDIIAEKGLIIKSKHESDFIVAKEKNARTS
jgi:hypothetical protein